MRISRIELQDFRGFEAAVFDLGGRDIVVLAGANGSGKSSVLDAAASVVACVPMALIGDPYAWFGGGEESNLRVGATWCSWRCRLRSGSDEQQLSLRAGAHPDEPQDRVDLKQLGFLTDWASALQAGATPPPTLPVLTYLHGGTTRFPTVLDTHADRLTGRLSAYVGAFDQDAAHFDAFERWFEQEENLENQERIQRRDLNWTVATLRTVRGAVTTFLSELGATHIRDMRVLRSHVGGQLTEVRGRLTLTREETTLFVDQLSDGERRLILLVADIARRMSVLNAHLDKPHTSPGIVLVDEIDLHLHPGWQRRVMPALRAAFPSVQIVVTTHSPQVLASVPSESVILMNNFQILPGHPKTQGRDTNTLLQTVFEVPERPAEVQDRLRRLYDLLEDHPKQARSLYRKLRQELEEDDPELVRVQTLLALAGG